MIIDLEEEKDVCFGANIKVIGVGGAGGNAVSSMVQSDDFGKVDFVLANTDNQALAGSAVEKTIQLGSKITKGLGAGSNPDVGRRAAEEDIEAIAHEIQDCDILFLTGGLGGGTGSGALPVFAQIAKEMGVLSVAIVTKPFKFEGKRRMRHAQEAIEQLEQTVDTLIVVPNQKLLELADPKISMLDAFSLSNSVLKQAIKGISDIITCPGHINVDFADVRSVMQGMGLALMGTGRAEGEGRAEQAALKAISSQLLEDVSIFGAQGVLINITGNTDLGLHEINEAASVVYDMVSEDANIILGSVIDPDIGNELMVTVIATGFAHMQEKNAVDKPAVAQQTVSQTTAVAYSPPGPEQVAAPVEQKEYKVAEKVTVAQVVEKVKRGAVQADTAEAVVAEQEVVSLVKQEVGADETNKQQVSLIRALPQPESALSLDLSDLDTPAFLRKKAKQQAEKK